MDVGAAMHCVEYRDLVAAHVDGQLTKEEAPLAMAHVADCPACAHLLETQRAVKQALRGRKWTQPTPEAVRQGLMARIDAADRARRWTGPGSRWWSIPALRLGAIGAVAVLLVVGTLLLRPRPQGPGSPVFDTIVAHYRAAEAERVALSARTDDPTELRAYYQKTGAFTFTNTVVDLEPLGFVLVGGTVTDLAGKKSTLSMYRSPRGLVICHRIQTDGVALPPGGAVAGGDRFYTVDGITICVHTEGDVLCFLASSMPPSDFMRLLGGHV